MITSSYTPKPCVAARALTAAFLLLIATPSTSPLRAVIFDPLSIEALTAQADVVLQGTVLSQTCQRDPAGRIFTRVEIEVTEVWKGAISGSPFQVVHGGGTLGERRSVVGGQVEYDVGEEVVVFLVRNTRGEGVTLGLRQGKFHVWKDAQTGVKLAASPFHGGVLSSPASAALKSATGARVDSTLELSQLKKRVEGASR